jgi:hypothetical protein
MLGQDAFMLTEAHSGKSRLIANEVKGVAMLSEVDNRLYIVVA